MAHVLEGELVSKAGPSVNEHIQRSWILSAILVTRNLSPSVHHMPAPSDWYLLLPRRASNASFAPPRLASCATLATNDAPLHKRLQVLATVQILQRYMDGCTEILPSLHFALLQVCDTFHAIGVVQDALRHIAQDLERIADSVELLRVAALVWVVLHGQLSVAALDLRHICIVIHLQEAVEVDVAFANTLSVLPAAVAMAPACSVTLRTLPASLGRMGSAAY
mmetsp:Transcript_55767/g.132943  ORF Transcript_55767/g.132943 Transcript_55767/m.132943 type:complete len:222 (+) Transcript_55767:322-987(+)